MSATLKHEFHQIPELVKSLEARLTHADILSCVRVCRLWHGIFISSLWRSIDDRDLAWTRILEAHDCPDKHGGKDINWLNDIFKKYGRHILHLRTTWSVIINAASAGGTCTNLRSLHVNKLYQTRTSKEKLEWRRIERSQRTEDQSRVAAIGPLISPIFDRILSPRSAGGRSLQQQLLDWTTIQRLWLLIQQNSRSLQALGLVRLDFMCNISLQFVYDVLVTLHNLAELTEDAYDLDVDVLLDNLPNLTRFTRREYSYPRIRSTHTQLRELDVCGVLSSKAFFALLEHLPSLDTLRFPKICNDNDEDDLFCPRTKVIRDNTPHTLKRLSLHVGILDTDDNSAREVFSYCPHLTHIELVETVLGEIPSGLVAIISTYCKGLQVFRQYPPIENDCSYWSDAPVNTLLPLLRTCKNLRVLDAKNQKFTVDELTNEPWASRDLETFNCLLAGFVRLSDDETVILEGERDHYPQRGINFVLDKHRRSQEQHIKLYDRLASMTRLITLDMGADHRSCEYFQSIYEADGEMYLDYGSPIPDTLELSLASGLDRLRTLKDLEVFGFEGFDDWVGKPELEWMADHWPKLRELRGLLEEKYHKIKYDERKAELREYMQTLRPDVVHKTSSGFE
ncbi:hypothetical protein BGW39_007099 [Mortierella sp. 14UC]|nr:hypothetical protein BGW39_007099 [Mortierella sp. 14UC]